ncbi:MAG: hypothetical protein ACRDDZ_01505 [Marinifilaceae bacterium]
MWFEDLDSLNDMCPPADATPTDNIEVFRLINNEVPNDIDFYSHRRLFPKRKFPVAECQCRSISVFLSEEDALSMKKLPSLRSKNIIKIKLKTEDGSIKNTPANQNPRHYSWWRSSVFNVDTMNYILL